MHEFVPLYSRREQHWYRLTGVVYFFREGDRTLKILNDLKVSLKLGGLLLVAFIALAVVGGVGYYSLQQSNTRINAMYEEGLVPLKLINQICTGTTKANTVVMEMMLTSENSKKQQLKMALADIGKESNALYETLGKVKLDAKGQELLKQVQESRVIYRDTRAKVLELAEKNQNAEAYALYADKVDALAKKYIENCDNLADHYSDLSEKMKAESAVKAAQANQITLSFIIVMFILLGIIGVMIVKAITSPLHSMVETCQILAAGDFQDKPQSILRKDELGQLADALVDMRTKLRKVLHQVNESAEQVAGSSEELTATSEQSSMAVTQVAEAINNVAEGAAKQLQAVDQAAAVVAKMSAGIQQAAAGSNQVADGSAQAAAKAKEGAASVEKAIDQMVHIEQTVNDSAQVVGKLGSKSKEIGQIVDTIAGIAGQTNLLALNAAIEAARAGEQGRGFAVVAEEVRKLAEQSQTAAKQIADMIGEIQGDTKAAVTAMNTGTQEVKVGTAVVTTAGKVFEEIVILILQVSAQIKEVSEAMHRVEGNSQEIVGTVQNINSISKLAVDESQTVSAATEEQSAAMEEIAASSKSLAILAQDLQTSISRFHL